VQIISIIIIKKPWVEVKVEQSGEVTELWRHFTIKTHAREVEINQAPEGAQESRDGYTKSPEIISAEI
jgi:hypothetical protein